MPTIVNGHLRAATPQDCGELVGLWALLFSDVVTTTDEPWRHHAAGWFTRLVDDPDNACFPVIEVDGLIVAAAIGTLQPAAARIPQSSVSSVPGVLQSSMAGVLQPSAVGTAQPDAADARRVPARTVRLMNVITLAEHRGRGFATTLVLDVLNWARSVAADRVDVSATADGLSLYARLGFTMTSARRMNLVL